MDKIGWEFPEVDREILNEGQLANELLTLILLCFCLCLRECKVAPDCLC